MDYNIEKVKVILIIINIIEMIIGKERHALNK